MSSASPSPWASLSTTQRRVVLELLRHGRLSRPQIQERVGVSAGSVTRLTTPLIDSGLLLTSTEKVATTGRPQTPLSLDARAESVVGVVLAPRVLTAVLADLRLGVHAVARREVTEHSPDAACALVAQALSELEDARLAEPTPLPAPSSLGLSLGGSSRDGRVVDQLGFYGWHNVPLAQGVEAATGVRTTIGNDLTALTLREAWFGAGRDNRRVCLLTVGAGVGYGLAVNGEVVSTLDSEAGLMGLVPVPDGAHPATSLPASERLTDTALSADMASRCGHHLEANEVVHLATQGDLDAVEACSSFARRLGRLIGVAAAFCLPDAVVLSGERAQVASLFEDQVMVGLASTRRASATPLQLIVRDHDRADWALGAAALALRARVLGEASQAPHPAAGPGA